MRFPILPAAFSCLLVVVDAWAAPSYGSYNLLWQDDFSGSGSTPPSAANWNTITNLHVNNEWETYTASTANLQISGGGTVQIVPWRDSSGAWTSGRIESTFTFVPTGGRVTFAEAAIRFGDSPTSNKQGIWPAFWLMGDSERHGTGWPQCGELPCLSNPLLQYSPLTRTACCQKASWISWKPSTAS